ncbi:hypothetical protein PHYBOEH_009930 [Phytophthora boehmeriae]|uniref:EF-hand domain-containing protein n=1 Tax=Phytophthora boehmeriae TaxID=109152 RepID=A0A8T1X574_9STRA|nr:hypothetical protein PHYBOEH_009930 [Phytophthora boehmeriae]
MDKTRMKNAKSIDKQKMLKDRQTLSASISLDALQLHHEQLEAPRRPVQFAITDILPAGNQKTSSKTLDSVLPTSPITREPLSLPRPGRTTADQTPPSAPKVMLKQEKSSPVLPSYSPERYAEHLEQAENTELFSYASALCHRATGRFLPRSVLQKDPEAQQRELERLQRDPEIMRAIDSVRVLSAQFKNVAQDTMGHRKELGHTLLRIEESYLKLFEKLLELSLRLYWEYEQRTEAQRREDRASIERWREQYERKNDECVRINKRLAAREIVHHTREIELQDYRGQLLEMERELGNQRELEAQILQLQEAASAQRILEIKLQEDLMQLRKKHEDTVEHQKLQREEMLVQQKEIVNGLRKTMKEKERLLMKQEATLHHLEEVALAAQVVHETRSSQTEVDDDGLWDVQDGVPRFVSKNVVHKMMWRRFNAFVACKNCGGRPLPKATKMNLLGSSSEGNEEVDIWSIDKGKKLSKKAAKRIGRIEQQWELPSSIVLFLSNLPKSVVAFPFYSLEKVITQIEAIYDDKFASDKVDEADGVAQEDMPGFICEYFLKTHGLRQDAEIGLYRFLVSVKNAYEQNPHVRLFARFSNLLKSEDEPSDDSLNIEPNAVADTDDKKKPNTKHIVPQPPESVPEPDFKSSKRSGYLDESFLRVFLEARYYLLRPPPRVVPKNKKIRRQEANAVRIEHVVQLESTKKWVPLDHAIATLRWYINCLPEDSISTYCRQVEHTTAIYDGRTLVEIAGNRLAVRAEMRRAMLASEKPDADSPLTQASADDKRPLPPRIVADVHKVLTLLMSALEQRHEGIKKDLTALFDSGDANHDCVLSLDEFGVIIRMRKPHFSDRRILRMFREALMGGADQSFALSMEAFVVVCNHHGLVSLLPDDRMTDPFANPASISTVTKHSRQKQSAAQPVESTTSPDDVVQNSENDNKAEQDTLLSSRDQEVEELMGWERLETEEDTLNT